MAAYGCANYGAVKTAGHEMTLETLVNNWEDYTVSWTGLSRGEPTALMFDPKGGDTKLVGDHWYRVESKEALAELITRLKENDVYYPIVWRMIGPDGQFYGYLYSGWRRTVVKPVDEKTVLVYGVPATLRPSDRSMIPFD